MGGAQSAPMPPAAGGQSEGPAVGLCILLRRWELLVYPPRRAPTLRRPRSQGVILRASDEDARRTSTHPQQPPIVRSTTSPTEIHALRPRPPDGTKKQKSFAAQFKRAQAH